MSLHVITEKLESIEKLLKEQAIQVKKILSMEDVCYMLGLSKKTIYKMVREKKIPAYRPIKGKIFFLPGELKFWIMAHRSVTIWSIEKLDSPETDSSDVEQ